jgi:hypothetical protein
MNQPAVPDVSPATLEVVPLGGVGEFGMNMMAVSWEDTTIIIDAGVMFPDPDQLGVDLIIPDMTYVEARGDKVKALVLTHGHEDHIGAVPHLLPLFDGPVYGTAMTLAFIEPKLAEHEIDAKDRLKTVKPRDVDDRAVHDRVHPRHAQHAGLRGARDYDAGRRDHPHGRFQDRSDADRRPAFRSAPLRRARRAGRAGALRRQHERRSPRLHRPRD